MPPGSGDGVVKKDPHLFLVPGRPGNVGVVSIGGVRWGGGVQNVHERTYYKTTYKSIARSAFVSSLIAASYHFYLQVTIKLGPLGNAWKTRKN